MAAGALVWSVLRVRPHVSDQLMLLHALKATQAALVVLLTPVTLLVAAERPKVGCPVPTALNITA